MASKENYFMGEGQTDADCQEYLQIIEFSNLE